MNFLEPFLDWASGCLNESDVARDYLISRGSSEDQWKRHRIGYVGGDYVADPTHDPNHGIRCNDSNSPNNWCDVCQFTRWSTSWVRESDDVPKIPIAGRRIAGSIVFPLTNYTGNPIGFQVRSLIEKSYDSFLMKRRPEGYFFGLSACMDNVWARREICLVEGAMDSMVISRLVTPCVAAITTSSLGEAQLKFLYRFVDKVNLCFDLDEAGRYGVLRFIQRQSDKFVSIQNIKYPKLNDKDKDVNDFWRRVGDEKFRHYFLNNMN
jgi:DNA primase